MRGTHSRGCEFLAEAAARFTSTKRGDAERDWPVIRIKRKQKRGGDDSGFCHSFSSRRNKKRRSVPYEV